MKTVEKNHPFTLLWDNPGIDYLVGTEKQPNSCYIMKCCVISITSNQCQLNACTLPHILHLLTFLVCSATKRGGFDGSTGL